MEEIMKTHGCADGKQEEAYNYESAPFYFNIQFTSIRLDIGNGKTHYSSWYQPVNSGWNKEIKKCPEIVINLEYRNSKFWTPR